MYEFYMVEKYFGQDGETLYFKTQEEATKEFFKSMNYDLYNDFKKLQSSEQYIILGLITECPYTIEEMKNDDEEKWEEAQEWLNIGHGYDVMLSIEYGKLDSDDTLKWLYKIGWETSDITQEMASVDNDTRVWYSPKQMGSWQGRIEKEKQYFEKHGDLTSFANAMAELEEEIFEAYQESNN